MKKFMKFVGIAALLAGITTGAAAQKRIDEAKGN